MRELLTVLVRATFVLGSLCLTSGLIRTLSIFGVFEHGWHIMRKMNLLDVAETSPLMIGGARLICIGGALWIIRLCLSNPWGIRSSSR